MISTSEIKVSVLVAAEYTELAVRALHTAYGLDAAQHHHPDVALTAARAALDRLCGRAAHIPRLRIAIMGGAMSWLSERHLVAAISMPAGSA